MAYLQVLKGRKSISVALLLFLIIFTVFLVAPVSATSSNTTSTTDPAAPDYNSLIDNYMKEFLAINPHLNTTTEDAAKISQSVANAKRLVLGMSGLNKRTPTPPKEYSKPISRRQNATLDEIDEARALVAAAQKEASVWNAYITANPRRNTYTTAASSSNLRTRSNNTIEPFIVNSTVARAAALVSEFDAQAKAANGTLFRDYSLPEEYSQYVKGTVFDSGHFTKRQTTTFWMENIAHTGTMPFGGVSDYAVYRNVKEYGAVGDGVTDDTAAINNAISDQNRCGSTCGSSSVQAALVYFPAGTYLISSPIIALYNTQLVGNPNDLPIIVGSSLFVGLGMITSDVYVPNGNSAEWYINQSNFLRQIRNFVFDVTQLPTTLAISAGIHWQVGQATSLQNLFFYLSLGSTSTQIGIFAENGSGGFMSDMVFYGGSIGIQCGNQQFTSRGLVFLDNNIGIDMLWDWGWTWKSLQFVTCNIGIRAIGADLGGSVQVMDTVFTNNVLAIYVAIPKGATAQQTFYITLQNVVSSGTTDLVFDYDLGTILDGGSSTIASWILGRIYDGNNPSGSWTTGGDETYVPVIPASMAGANAAGQTGVFFEQSKPQYNDVDASSFFSVKDQGAKGDGVTDDTVDVGLMLFVGSFSSIIVYFPAGSYIITGSLQMYGNTIVVGECWSQLVASGAFFSDMTNPRPLLIVGEEESIGAIQMQDMLFTATGATAGVILVQWNIAEDTQGSAAMWDCHFRVGGALGTNLQASQCPTGTQNSACIGASMMLWMTGSSSAYLENMWAWTADHDMDNPTNPPPFVNVFTGRGILIESTGPTWLYGTAAEHAVLYQYQLVNANNIFMGMIQTESPYFPPVPAAPAPFGPSLGTFHEDPSFSNCATSSNPTTCAFPLALSVIGTENLWIYGAGLYNFFQNYAKGCEDTQNCQQAMVEVDFSGEIWLYNLYTIGAIDMIAGILPVTAAINTNLPSHPFVSTVSAWLPLTGLGEFKDQAPSPTNNDLSDTSDCTDLYGLPLESWMWDATNAGPQMLAFYNSVGQSMSCSLPSPCGTPDCDAIEAYDTEGSGSGWKYCVLVSMSRFNQYLADLYTAVTNSNAAWAGMIIPLQQTFDPANNINDLFLEELFNAIATIGLILAVFAAGAPAGVVITAGVMANAVAGGINAYLYALEDSTKDETWSLLVDDAKAANAITIALQASLADMNSNLLSVYQYQGVTLDQVFAGGAFLDDRNIPVLNVDTSMPSVSAPALEGFFTDLINAVVINQAWIRQNTFILCYPMTSDEFNSTVVPAGSNDGRLKLWVDEDGGQGCYFQDAQLGDGGTSEGVNINPNGWGSLNSADYPFTTWDVIQGSYDAFKIGGYMYNETNIVTSTESILSARTSAWNTQTFDWPGIWTIPLCMLNADSTNPYAGSEVSTALGNIAGFVYNLEGPGETDENPPSWCYCFSAPDKNGNYVDTIMTLDIIEPEVVCNEDIGAGARRAAMARAKAKFRAKREEQEASQKHKSKK